MIRCESPVWLSQPVLERRLKKVDAESLREKLRPYYLSLGAVYTKHSRNTLGNVSNKSLGVWVRCNKCPICKDARRILWQTRLEHELFTSDSAVFLTLTYDDAHLPVVRVGDNVVSTLRHGDVQKFLKRLRKKIYPTKIKYYCVGEYGDKTDRPHYHLIIFGWRPVDVEYVRADVRSSHLLCDIWGNGYVSVGSVEPASIRYTVSYMLWDVDNWYDGFRVRPYMRCSQGLGKNWSILHTDLVESVDGLIRTDGRQYSVPRYYKRIHNVESPIESSVDASIKVDAYIDNLCNVIPSSAHSINNKNKIAMKQRSKNIKKSRELSDRSI